MDKLYHFIAGLVICTIVGLGLFYIVGCTANFSKGAGLLSAIACGAIKETIDAYRSKSWTVKTWNMFDFLATCVGGFGGIFILIVGFKL